MLKSFDMSRVANINHNILPYAQRKGVILAMTEADPQPRSVRLRKRSGDLALLNMNRIVSRMPLSLPEPCRETESRISY
jgi:hypothetical protein